MREVFGVPLLVFWMGFQYLRMLTQIVRVLTNICIVMRLCVTVGLSCKGSQ